MTASSPAPRSAFDRDEARRRLGAEEFDVVVIGGGVTGAGVALDAAARGLRVALLERDDFASGTSSKSSKLVHGGLRYLSQKEYRLVYENLAERQRLLDNAPHLVEPLAFLIPIFGKDGAVNKVVAKAYRSVLWIYDLTGGVRIGKRHKRLTNQEVIDLVPSLRADRVAAGFLYWDARADDARLTLTLVRTAVLDHGAVAANYSEVVGIDKDASGKVAAVRLADGTVVRTKSVVNAGGVWADRVRALDEGDAPDTIRPAKGVHVTIPAAKLSTTIAAVVPVPKDRRSIFVVPWGEFVYLGTTDTDYEGSLDEPTCTEDDISYLLDAVNLFIKEPVLRSDVLGTWAGLRPLVRDASSERTADLSRRHAVSVSESGTVSVTGGKLTTYRKMAADAVDEVVKVVGRGGRKSPTKKLRLHGAAGLAELRAPEAASRLGTDDATLDHLVRRYGTDARAVLAMVEADPELGKPLVAGLPYLRTEAVYAARYEMAHTLADVLSRRTRALLLDRDAALGAAAEVAALLAPELGWSAADADAQTAAFRAAAMKGHDDAPATTSSEGTA